MLRSVSWKTWKDTQLAGVAQYFVLRTRLFASTWSWVISVNKYFLKTCYTRFKTAFFWSHTHKHFTNKMLWNGSDGKNTVTSEAEEASAMAKSVYFQPKCVLEQLVFWNGSLLGWHGSLLILVVLVRDGPVQHFINAYAPQHRVHRSEVCRPGLCGPGQILETDASDCIYHLIQRKRRIWVRLRHAQEYKGLLKNSKYVKFS